MQHRDLPAADSAAVSSLPMIDALPIRGLSIGVGAPKVVVSITSRTADEVAEQAAEIRASPHADMAELRLDHLDSVLCVTQVVELVKTTCAELSPKPLLVTFRSKTEGGEREFSDADYFALYSAIIDGAPIDVIDIEMMKPQTYVAEAIARAHQKGIAVILSNHEFESTPTRSVIVGRLLRQQALGADILKIATMPQSAEDVLTLMSASVEMKNHHARKPLLTMAMGALGIPTRLMGELTGSAFTYASIGSTSAPGQLEAKSVKSVLEIIDHGSHR